MRKTIAFILMLCLFILTGCGGSGGALKEDDFHIYENGKTIMQVTDLTYGSFFSILQKNSLEGRVLETKRGIKIGSTAREVANAYKNIVCIVLWGDTGGVINDTTLEEHLNDAENDSTECTAIYSLYRIDGKMMTPEEYFEYARQNNITDHDEMMDSGKLTQYSIDITIKGNVVEDIQVSRYP